MADPRPYVVIVCQNLAPEANAAARRITDLARHLVAAGWVVRVVTQAPHHPLNRVFPGYGHQRKTTTVEDGVTVVRYRPWITPKANYVLRFASEALFAVQSALHLFRQRPALILTSSPYMALGPMGLAVAKLVGARFAWDVRDLTWQYLAATGRPSWGIDRALERVMRFTARHAHALTTATEGQLTYFVDRPERAQVITNGLTRQFLDRLHRPPRRRTPEESPCVAYVGLVGYPQGLTVLVDVAARLPNVAFAIVGDGPERAALEADARRRGLRNLSFPGFVEGEALERWYAEADVLVAHLRRAPAFEIAQPSKLWEYMATGRPVVYGGEGEAVRILERERIGVAVPPESADDMTVAIRGLLADPVRAADIGARGRAFVEVHRNRDAILSRWEALLRATLAS
jgi:colanic acid biosynthesis glycosyl transferase WcaI